MSPPLPSTTDEHRPGGAGVLGDRTVSRIGYGAMQLGRLAGDRPAAVAVVRRAVELGVDHVDTAQFHGGGVVSAILAEALRPEDGVVVATKIGADPYPGGPFPTRVAQRPEELGASVEDNVRSLDLEQIALVNLRRKACVQNDDNLLACDDEALLDLCVAEGIAWVPFFPLGSAFPGMPKVTDEPAVTLRSGTGD